MVGSKLSVLALAFAGVARACEVLTKEGNPECYKNVEWAMNDGIKNEPEWYNDMHFLNATTTVMEDFQYALAMGEEAHGNGRKWNCSIPCVLTAEAQAHKEKVEAAAAAAAAETSAPSVSPTSEPTLEPTLVPTEAPSMSPTLAPSIEAAPLPSTSDTPAEESTTTTTGAPGSGSLEWYWWLLIILGVCCLLPLLGLAASAFLCYDSVAWIFAGSAKRSPQKKKRTIGSAVSAPAAPVAAAPAPASLAAPVQAYPVPLPTYQPVTYVTAPQAHSVVYAAPQPVAPVAPVATVTPVQHVVTAQAPATPYYTTPAFQQ
eukprot:TRINITY_DN5733_c0_g1_i2.p1 TRINITY_DN5733_c0_g1~~TRINITY_DN5733_c0_g1_i2.p1  ORF type:complete len:325 (+),score=80.47 TRINITY_DN5733_c0_g1_i2:30-977(+)